MYTVYAYDDMVCDAVAVFEGSLEECREYVADDEFDEFEIVAPDGFTSVEQTRRKKIKKIKNTY